mmetsp:Transcript_83428/g.241450  ORF Transcript_83428/g.241450 Transcript_83428/m.241450 type:complete len:123 (-) Transcript_83428:89-457(-)
MDTARYAATGRETDTRQQQLLASGRQMAEARAAIAQANATALETEEVGFQALRDLVEQRERLQQASSQVERIDEAATTARLKLTALSRRLSCRKASLWFALMVLWTTFVAIIYFFWIKPKRS